MKNLDPSTPGTGRCIRYAHPLLRIGVAATLATTITWLGGLMFGPLSDARARQLAQGMSATPQRGAEVAASSAVMNAHAAARTLPSGPAAQARMSG